MPFRLSYFDCSLPNDMTDEMQNVLAGNICNMQNDMEVHAVEPLMFWISGSYASSQVTT